MAGVFRRIVVAFLPNGGRPSSLETQYRAGGAEYVAPHPDDLLAEVKRRLGTADVDRGIGATALIDHVPHDSASGSTS